MFDKLFLNHDECSCKDTYFIFKDYSNVNTKCITIRNEIS